ncbi:Hypothetical predicted protein [Pelobates cultripes]|uniref:Uncharacterized protein n=1 Tax=Pelobates cultripes TaxID=61616 RepID=A0AAD1W1C3_PELCU|nr:Hypothetical predicted protein [Pelobates cultripes]
MLLLDRVHRVPRQRQIPDTSPRDVLLRAHYDHVKEHILTTSRNRTQPPEGYDKIQIFPDLSATTLRRRKEFAPITAALRSNELRYCWGYPTKLQFFKDDAITTISSIEDGVRRLALWGINLQIESTRNSSNTKLQLEWTASPGRR